MAVVKAKCWRGYWWLPESDRRVPGVLRYDPVAGVSLELIGSLQLRDGEMVLGEASGEALTILGAVAKETTYRPLTPFPDGTGANEQVIVGSVVLSGVLLETPEEPAFSGMTCEAEGLLRWENSSEGLVLKLPDLRSFFQETRPMEILLHPLGDPRADCGNFTVSLEHTYIPTPPQRSASSLSASVAITSSLRIAHATPVSFETLRDQLFSLLDLVALAVGHTTRITQWKFELPVLDGQRRPAPGTVYCSMRAATPPAVSPEATDEPVFTLNDLSLDELMAIWHTRSEKLGVPIRAFLAERANPDVYLETKLKRAITGIDALSKRLAATPGWSREEDKVPNKSGDLQDPWTFQQRLLQLCKHLPDSVTAALVPDRQRWAETTRQIRQKLIHEGWLTTAPEEALAVLYVTRAITLLTLVHELGLSEERLVYALQHNQELTHAARYGAQHFASSASPN